MRSTRITTADINSQLEMKTLYVITFSVDKNEGTDNRLNMERQYLIKYLSLQNRINHESSTE